MVDLNPALVRFKAESAIIGHIVVGFGELEVLTCRAAALAIGDQDTIFKTLYNLRSTSARIESADTLMRRVCSDSGIEDVQNTSISIVENCLRIRNQYAHCNWADHPDGGLFFADLQDSADKPGFAIDWKHIDVPLLEKQEAYFGNARHWLLYLEDRITGATTGERSYVPVPPKQDPPQLYNLASQHVPPWLNEDQKAQHLERARVAERPSSQPVRPPSILRLTEDEWIAKYRKEGRPLPRAAE